MIGWPCTEETSRFQADTALQLCWVAQSFTLTAFHGMQIKKATGATGSRIGKITEDLVKWQLAHPNATQKDAETWLSNVH